jgi:hypothetical protein
MPAWIDAATPYLMFGASLVPAIPLIVLGATLLSRKHRAAAPLLAAGAALAALFPLTWIYLLVVLVCTGRNGGWIC